MNGIISDNHEMAERAHEVGGYHVVPRQLAIACDELRSTAHALTKMASDVRGTFLAADDLGFLGKEADAPDNYNRAMADCADHFATLSHTVWAAGEILDEVAKHYAAMDDGYYRKFGRLSDN